MTPAIPAASASAAPRRAGKGAAPATPAWSAQPPSRTAAHANTAFAGAPRIPRPPSPQAARAPALFAPSPPLAHAAQTVPQPQAIPTQTHPIHRSSIKVGNDARTLKGVALTAAAPALAQTATAFDGTYRGVSRQLEGATFGGTARACPVQNGP